MEGSPPTLARSSRRTLLLTDSASWLALETAVWTPSQSERTVLRLGLEEGGGGGTGVIAGMWITCITLQAVHVCGCVSLQCHVCVCVCVYVWCIQGGD